MKAGPKGVPKNESVRDSILLRGPWFLPSFTGRLTLSNVLAILIEPSQSEVLAALLDLVAEGALKHWPANDSYEPVPQGWRIREQLLRARGWRHPALVGMGAGSIEFDELMLAVIAAPRFAQNRGGSGGAFLETGEIPSRSLDVYFVGHSDDTVRRTMSGLIESGLVESRADGSDWWLSLTGHGERAYRRRLQKFGLREDETMLDEKEKYTITVFYVWQSDYNPSRTSIAEKLEEVAARLNGKHKLVVPLRIETAARVGDGATRIDVVLLQRIREADIVVADVTPVCAYDNRLMPNPNVLIEIGYALASRAPEHLMLIARRARIAELLQQNPDARFPFDIDHVNRIEYEAPATLSSRLEAEFETRLRTMGFARQTPH